MYSYGPPHMAVQMQDDQHEHTFSSYVRIRDVVLKTYLGRWTIGRSGERGSGISMLPVRHDDDDDDKVLPLNARVNLTAMAMEVFSALPKLQHEYSHTIRFLVSHLGHSLGRGLIPLQRCNRCILQPKPTGPSINELCVSWIEEKIVNVLECVDAVTVELNDSLRDWMMTYDEKCILYDNCDNRLHDSITVKLPNTF